MRLLATTLLVVLVVHFPAHAQLRVFNGIAAVVNDAVITVQEVSDLTAPGEEGLRRQYWDKPEALRRELDKIWNENLELLVERQVILQDYKTSPYKLPESFVEDRLEDEIKRRIHERFVDRVNLTKALQARGKTYETYRQEVRDEIIANYMAQRHVGAAIIISPAKIERYYATNLHKFKVGDEVKLRVLVLSVPTVAASADVRKRGLEIRAKLDAGAPFAEMASVYSEGSQRREGGDWGWRGPPYLKRGLFDVAFPMTPGQHTGLIGHRSEADESYWIYRYDDAGQITAARKYSREDQFLEEKKPGAADGPNTFKEPDEYYLMLVEGNRPAHTRPLTEVQDEIEKELVNQEISRLHKKWISRLRAKSFVRFY